MGELPLVSVIVTTHNRRVLLKRALKSVKAQAYQNLELIVIDDGSVESVEDVVSEFKGFGSVKFYRNETAKGACAARNKGIELASGKFVAGLDDDDEMMPNRIEILLDAYDDRFSFVTSDVLHVYQNRELVWKKDEIIPLERLLYSNQVGNQGLIKRDRMIEVGGFDESLKAAQDYDLWVRLSEKYGPIRNVQEPLQKVYIVHGGEQITKPKNQLEGYLQFYKKHKSRMNSDQRKYQLYNIRKATGKAESFINLFGWVPKKFLWKELKVLILSKFL
ncbi:MAG: glycosyltransferase [Gracilimonas sp.]|nr:glycosyltransferase [Gracilimonas sp.]